MLESEQVNETSAAGSHRGTTRMKASRVHDLAGMALPDVPQGRHYRPAQLRQPGQGVADGLGVFSVLLGLTQLIAPDAIARLVGVPPSSRSRATMRVLGLRGLTSGAGVLSNGTSVPWLWSRLAGDVLDVALLTAAVGRRHDDRTRASRALMAVAGVAAIDYFAARTNHRTQQLFDSVEPEATVSGPLEYGAPDIAASGTGNAQTTNEEIGHLTTDAVTARRAGHRKVRSVVTINRSASELYAYWRNFENLPNFMKQLASVTTTGEGRSHWVTRGPGGTQVEWDAEIVADEPDALIAWQSLAGGDVRNAGTVRFIPVPSERGTEVHVELDYDPPGGALGVAVAKLFRAEPGQQIRDDLRAFKQVMEAGEVLFARKAERLEGEQQGLGALLPTPQRAQEVRV